MYLVDTNILIYHFNNSIPKKSKTKIRTNLKKNFNISIITKMEFLGFKGHTKTSYKSSIDFINYANVLNLDNEIADEVIQLKRKKKIKLPDAIIAATTICNDLVLVTRNEDDFAGISLKIYNPFK